MCWLRSDDAYQALEGQLANQKLGRLLVPANLTESDGTGLIAVGLLDTAGGWGTLAGSLGGELLAGSLATGGLTGGLLGASHCCGCLMESMKCCDVVDERGCEWVCDAGGKVGRGGRRGGCFNTRKTRL